MRARGGGDDICCVALNESDPGGLQMSPWRIVSPVVTRPPPHPLPEAVPQRPAARAWDGCCVSGNTAAFWCPEAPGPCLQQGQGGQGLANGSPFFSQPQWPFQARRTVFLFGGG
jgi:hypothetical protein